MKFSICLDAVFNEKNFIDGMKEIKTLGINDFEFWSWWDKDLDGILKVTEELNMNITALCTKFVSLVDSSLRAKYIEGLQESITAAEKLDCSILITQVGNEVQSMPREQQHENLVNGLKQCALFLEEAEITLVFEPLNTIYDHKGYYLYSSEEAFQIAEEVNSPRIKVLYDIYHQQVTEGNLINSITGNIDRIGHFHAAGHPGRNELYMGEINYPQVIEAIDRTSFRGYMGLEYFPYDNAGKGLRKIIAEIINI